MNPLQRREYGAAGPAGVGAAWALFLLPFAISIAKQTALPGATLLHDALSLNGLPEDVSAHLHLVLMVPLGTVVVVLFRLTLGLRVLGPFRPILIAIGLSLTGVVSGLLFLALVMGIVALVRPFLRSAGLPYFARVAVLLSGVAMFVIATVLTGGWLEVGSLIDVAFFPIVVLCLAAESFAKALSQEGARSAVWRAGTTTLAALGIVGLAAIPGLVSTLSGNPELLIAHIGLVMLIATYLDLRLFADMNPSTCVRKSTSRLRRPRRDRSEHASATGLDGMNARRALRPPELNGT